MLSKSEANKEAIEEEKVSVITPEIKAEVKRLVTELKTALKDDEEFAHTLINNILLLGEEVNERRVCFEDIEKSIWNKYPDLWNHPIAPSLKTISYHLTTLIFGKHLLSPKVYDVYEVKSEIIEAFYPEDELNMDSIEQTDTMGQVEQKFDDMEI